MTSPTPALTIVEDLHALLAVLLIVDAFLVVGLLVVLWRARHRDIATRAALRSVTTYLSAAAIPLTGRTILTGVLTITNNRRSKTMATRTITGNLAADPEVVDAGSIQITKFKVIENTGEFRQGKWVEDDTATTHFVEGKFELGSNAAATLHKGDPVIVIGKEKTNSWGAADDRQYGRVIQADAIGVDLSRATAVVTRNARAEAAQ